MQLFRWIPVLGPVWLVFSCTAVPRPGRCDRTTDCTMMSGYAGYVCNLDLTPQGDGRCVPGCHATGDCGGGRVCDFDSQGVGRCLFPPDAGGVSTGGGASGAGGGVAGAGGGVAGAGGGRAGGGGGGVAGAGGGRGGADAGVDMAGCSPACGGSTPVCLGRTCVGCGSSADCTTDPTKPICDTTAHACVACSSDAQCVAKLGANPGVCMAHQDGRCASDAEAVYVQNIGGCTATFSNFREGTAATPYCSLDPLQAYMAGSATRTVAVIRGTVNAATQVLGRNATQVEFSLIGQQAAFVAGAAQPAFDLNAGKVYIRGIKFSASAAVGIRATSQNTTSDFTTLRLDTVVVDSCQQGGILLDGVAFDIRNCTLTNNGPGSNGGALWGGIYVKSLPAVVGSPTSLGLLTVEMNKQVGIDCAVGPISGTGIFASQNAGGVDIAPTCGISSCPTVGPSCGANH